MDTHLVLDERPPPFALFLDPRHLPAQLLTPEHGRLVDRSRVFKEGIALAASLLGGSDGVEGRTESGDTGRAEVGEEVKLRLWRGFDELKCTRKERMTRDEPREDR